MLAMQKVSDHALREGFTNDDEHLIMMMMFTNRTITTRGCHKIYILYVSIQYNQKGIGKKKYQ
jgi:hypothetical protein